VEEVVEAGISPASGYQRNLFTLNNNTKPYSLQKCVFCTTSVPSKDNQALPFYPVLTV
jgi:hypothetical protein